MDILCAICKINDDRDLIQPHTLGINTINRASSERNDTLLMKVGDYVNVDCRKKYIHKWYVVKTAAQNDKTSSSRSTRSSSGSFDFRKKLFPMCIFCYRQGMANKKSIESGISLP